MRAIGTHGGSPPTPRARERILDASYALFTRHGIRRVGVEAVIREAGVARMTLFRNFPTKSDLIRAFLERREEVWTHWLVSEVERRASGPEARLLAVFDVFDEWFHREDFEGCSFINTLVETSGSPADPVREDALRRLEAIHDYVCRLAGEAGLDDPEALARQWDVLMRGAIVAAQGGDSEAAHRARDLASLRLDQLRPTAAPSQPVGRRRRRRGPEPDAAAFAARVHPV